MKARMFLQIQQNPTVFLNRVLGSLLALGLCTMLYFIYRVKMESDMKTRQKSSFLDTIAGHLLHSEFDNIINTADKYFESISA